MIRIAVVLSMIALPLTAAAEGAPAQCDGLQECTEYFMDTDVLTGDVERPDHDLYMVRGQIHQPRLIKVRNHFVNELRKSVEDI